MSNELKILRALHDLIAEPIQGLAHHRHGVSIRDDFGAEHQVEVFGGAWNRPQLRGDERAPSHLGHVQLLEIEAVPPAEQHTPADLAKRVDKLHQAVAEHLIVHATVPIELSSRRRIWTADSFCRLSPPAISSHAWIGEAASLGLGSK